MDELDRQAPSLVGPQHIDAEPLRLAYDTALMLTMADRRNHPDVGKLVGHGRLRVVGGSPGCGPGQERYPSTYHTTGGPQ